MHSGGQTRHLYDVANFKLLPFLPVNGKVTICRALKDLEGTGSVARKNHARLESDESFVLEGLVAEVDGSRILRQAQRGHTSLARQIGLELADALLEKGGRAILDKLYQ